MTDSTKTATVADSLRLEGDLSPNDWDRVVARLAVLDHRLRTFPAGGIELVLSMKERDEPSQRTVLEASVPGRPRLVATSTEIEVDTALTEVRDDLIRQLTDVQNRSEPRQNRKLRETLD